MPITEYLTFRTTPQIFKDHDQFVKLRNGAREAGIVNQSYGVGIEDNEVVHWIIQFDQGFGPDKFVWNDVKYGDFGQEIMKIAREPPESAFMSFDGREAFAKEVTASPVTEIATLAIKEDVAKEDVSKILGDISVRLRKAKNSTGASWGEDPKNKPNKVHLFIGWQSIEDHITFTQTDEFKEIGGLMAKIVADASMVHVAFADHASPQ
ncbi:hypothetical protein D9758_010034 [Tetrapyrgos nigripes]|uniref:ABM domain-containing protein n=1 Tax=Tetrapyrgos nigripes TaxID=182062 RepID=A0A8H5FSY7_9AGAR|nr:hypothetical protein D9758_010034 [Tetrapyrgos nigripes]